MPNVKRVTIAEVAKAAGVSATAVSFAFNKPEQLSADTVLRILAAAHELGYSPDPIARALISRGTGIIGLLFPGSIEASFTNPFSAEFMKGVGQVCDESSLSMLIVSPIEGSLENAVSRAPVNGYIVLGFHEDHFEIEPLRRRRVPFVIVDGDATTVSSVNAEDYNGAYSAADYLLAKGHRNILIVSFAVSSRGYDDDQTYGIGLRRMAAYRDAFSSYGVPFETAHVLRVPSSLEGGAAALSAALGTGFAPTAVLALSDVMAIGVLLEAGRRGIRVPDDLEIIGFDDIPMAVSVGPALSTVHQPVVEKGQVAARMLIRALEGSSPAERVVLPTHLVLRGTTRP